MSSRYGESSTNNESNIGSGLNIPKGIVIATVLSPPVRMIVGAPYLVGTGLGKLARKIFG